MSKREEMRPTFKDGRGNERPYPVKNVTESFGPQEFEEARQRLALQNLPGRLKWVERVVAEVRREFKDQPDAPEMRAARDLEQDVKMVRQRVAEGDAVSAAMHGYSIGHGIGRLELFAVKEDWALGRVMRDGRRKGAEAVNAQHDATEKFRRWNDEAQAAKSRPGARSWWSIATRIAQREGVHPRTVYNRIERPKKD